MPSTATNGKRSSAPPPGGVKINPMQVVGRGGTAIFNGNILSTEKEPELSGNERYKKFSEIMVNVAILGAGIRYFLNLVGKVSWKAVGPDESSQSKEFENIVEKEMNSMETTWSRVVRRAAMFKFQGFSTQEWTAVRREDGKIGFLDIESRPQHTIERWDVDETGKVLGVWQRSPQDFIERYLPRQKLIYLVDDSITDSPEGSGLLRQIYPHAQRLIRYERLEGDGFETDLRGIPVMRAPLALLEKLQTDGKLSKEEVIKMTDVMKEFIQNHVRGPKTGLLLDSITYQSLDESATPSPVKQWDAELMSGESSAFADLGGAINRKIYDIASLIGVEHLLLGSNSTGSFALSKDKTNNFFLTVDSALAEIASSLKNDFTGTLFNLNGWDKALMPDLKPEPVKFQDIEQISGVLRDMAQAGAVIDPTDPVINDIRDLLGISRADLDKIISEAALKPTPKEDPAVIPDGSTGGN